MGLLPHGADLYARQRLYIVLTALLLFAAVDIWMIVSSLSGHSEPLPAEHIEVSVPLKP